MINSKKYKQRGKDCHQCNVKDQMPIVNQRLQRTRLHLNDALIHPSELKVATAMVV